MTPPVTAQTYDQHLAIALYMVAQVLRAGSAISDETFANEWKVYWEWIPLFYRVLTP